MMNVTVKLIANKGASLAVASVAKHATTILTNPVSAAAVTVIAVGGMMYKHAENKDKRLQQSYAR
jgi:hypothetical protein